MTRRYNNCGWAESGLITGPIFAIVVVRGGLQIMREAGVEKSR
jgi:hypothetical protein